MGDLWLKIKVWTKTTLFSIVFIYAMIFIFSNLNKTVKFWWWFGRNDETSVLVLSTSAFFAGAIMTVLVWTTFKTIRQMRTKKDKSRLDRLERDQADLKAKAAMLQSSSIPLSSPAKPDSGSYSSNP